MQCSVNSELTNNNKICFVKFNTSIINSEKTNKTFFFGKIQYFISYSLTTTFKEIGHPKTITYLTENYAKTICKTHLYISHLLPSDSYCDSKK